jgi:hypothetical protein
MNEEGLTILTGKRKGGTNRFEEGLRFVRDGGMFLSSTLFTAELIDIH